MLLERVCWGNKWDFVIHDQVREMIEVEIAQTFGRLVASLSLQTTRFDPRPLSVGFVLPKWHWERFSSLIPFFSCQCHSINATYAFVCLSVTFYNLHNWQHFWIVHLKRQCLKNPTQNFSFVETWMNVVRVTSVAMFFLHAISELTFVNLLTWLPQIIKLQGTCCTIGVPNSF